MNNHDEQLVDLRDFHKEKAQEYNIAHRERLFSNLKAGLWVGAALAALVYVTQKFLSYEEVYYVALAILTLLVGAFGTFAWLEWRHAQYERKLEGDYISEAVEKAVGHLQAQGIYSGLIAGQLKLNWQMSDVFAEIVNKTFDDGGGIVITATSDEYIRYLGIALSKANKSYMAILRGGDSEAYRPRWFFRDEHNEPVVDHNDRLIVDPDKRIYLQEVKQASALEKIRVIILDEQTLYEDFSDESIREQFLELTTGQGLRLFFATPRSLDSRLFAYKKYWVEDYAIIDGTMVLKHNSSSSLLFASIGVIEGYNKIFEYLREDLADQNQKRFVELTKDSIGDLSWDAWLAKVRNNQHNAN